MGQIIFLMADIYKELRNLEKKFRETAIVLGNLAYVQKHGRHPQYFVYDYEHTDLTPIKEQLLSLINTKVDPPPINTNTWWTFLACQYFSADLATIFIPKDIIKLLYKYYVKSQYGTYSNDFLTNLINGRPWLHYFIGIKTIETHIINKSSLCIHDQCGIVVRYNLADIRSKLSFEKWCNEHMIKDHKISMWSFLNNKDKCDHITRIANERIVGGSHVHVDTSYETICKNCGKILTARVEME